MSGNSPDPNDTNPGIIRQSVEEDFIMTGHEIPRITGQKRKKSEEDPKVKINDKHRPHASSKSKESKDSKGSKESKESKKDKTEDTNSAPGIHQKIMERVFD